MPIRKGHYPTARAYDLKQVARFVSRRPGITMNVLKDELGVSIGTAGRYLHQLEARGTLKGVGSYPRRYFKV